MGTYTPDIAKAAATSVSARTAIIAPVTANIAFVMELTLVPLLLPAIQFQFSLSIGDMAWVFNAYGIAVAIGVLLGGWGGDAFDTRKVFGYGVAFFAIGSLFAAAAQSFEVLIIGRTLQGFGAGIFSPLVPLLLTRASPQKPGRVLIVLGSIAGYVAALAPLIYGSLLEDHDWNHAFAFIAVLAILARVILSRTPVAVDAAPHRHVLYHYTALFRAGDLWATFVYVFCTYGAITYYLFRLPLWLSSQDVTAVSVGLVLSIMWLTFSGLSTLLRNKVDGPDLRTIMLAAPVFIIVGLPLSFYDDNILLLIMSSVLVGSGLACSNAPSTQLVLKFAPQGMSAVSTSLDITFARLGGIMTVALLAKSDFASAVPAIGLSCLIAAACALSVSRGLVDSS